MSLAFILPFLLVVVSAKDDLSRFDTSTVVIFLKDSFSVSAICSIGSTKNKINPEEQFNLFGLIQANDTVNAKVITSINSTE